MSPRAKAAAVVLGAFVAGAVGGSALTLHVAARRVTALFAGDPRGTLARIYGAELGRRLHLRADQRVDVERIVDADHAELARVGRTVYPELVEIRRRRHARIREILTPEQRPVFDGMVEDFERRRREELDLGP